MNEKPVLLDATRSGVAVVTLNRSHLENTFNPEVIDALLDICEELKGADGVRCVILEGAGDSFSAGDDLSWARFEADYTREDHLEDAKDQAELLLAWRDLPKPTIALVHGAAAGTAVGLIAACDIAIADRTANFLCADVKRGIVPAVAAPFIIEAIGARAARRFLLTGERIGPEEALRLGLVHSLVRDREELAQVSEALVAGLYEAAPHALAATKEIIGMVDREPVDTQLLAEMSRQLAHSFMQPEAREGFDALLERRKPSWAEE
jgi:methylglutaconyl-CoA hydratase